MALAEGKDILAGPRGIFDIEPEIAALKKRDQRNGRRERAAGMPALVDSVATLLQRENAYIGVFNGEKPENTLAHQKFMRNNETAAEGSPQAFCRS